MERGQRSQTRLKCIALGAVDAGKTSILRRFFLKTSFDGRRVPTVGADFYTASVHNPAYADSCQGQEGQGHDDHHQEEKKASDRHYHDTETNNDQNQNRPARVALVHAPAALPRLADAISTKKKIGMQVWDTAGKERFMATKRKAKYSASLSDAFFRHADAAMLVYDATSSTSFTQLLQWHSDLTEKMKSLEQSQEEGKYHKRNSPFPVLIVANKMDLFERDIANKPASALNRIIPQRDVLGLANRTFKGKDRPYEYSASPLSNNPASSRREEISTYMRTGNTWTTDGSYLDSVLNAEDGSYADRDMVLLWCMRNGLKHVEVSALDGSGIDAAMEALVELALMSANGRLLEQKKEGEIPAQKPQQHPVLSNDVLDLHQRYAPQPKGLLCFPPLFCPR